MHPQVASSTSATMILFTSATALIVYIFSGTITLDYGLYFFALGLVSNGIGHLIGHYVMEESRRLSFVSLSIGIVIAISVLLLIVEQVINPSTEFYFIANYHRSEVENILK